MLPCQRHLFSLPEELIYLNCAHMSPSLKAAEEAGMEGLRRKNNPVAIPGSEWFAPLERLRGLVGQLLHASPDRVAFIPAASYGIALAVRNTPLAKGGNVVLPAHEFPSDVYGWREKCRETGAELRMVARPADLQFPGAAWNDALVESIDEATAVVSLTPLHWTDGTVFDLERIGARAREVGALFVVDGTQWVGAMPFNFERVQPDLLVCASYKWCMGPYNYGFAVLGDKLLAGRPLEESWQQREGSENFSNLTAYTDRTRVGGRRFDMGEHANFILVPMLTEGIRQVIEWGVENIQEYCEGLAGTLRAALAGSALELGPQGEHSPHLFGISVPGEGQVGRLIETLAAHHISVSQRGSAIRVSPHLYNRPEEMEKLAETMLGAIG